MVYLYFPRIWMLGLPNRCCYMMTWFTLMLLKTLYPKQHSVHFRYILSICSFLGNQIHELGVAHLNKQLKTAMKCNIVMILKKKHLAKYMKTWACWKLLWTSLSLLIWYILYSCCGKLLFQLGCFWWRPTGKRLNQLKKSLEDQLRPLPPF